MQQRPVVFFSLLTLFLAGMLITSGCETDVGVNKRSESPLAPEILEPTSTTAVETFTLRAYGADSVTLAGTFNNWNSNDLSAAFTLDPDGYTWRLTTTLSAGLQQYKFVLHSGATDTWMTDPEAHEVLGAADPAQANGVRGRILPIIDPLPYIIDRTQLVIYEANLNELSAPGTFAGAVAALTSGAHLSDLGVNAIELLPITAPSYNGWGYDPSLYFAPNPAFGWPNFFAMFVDACHDRGIAVILDMVVNHASGGSALKQLDNFSGSYDFTTTETNPWGLVELNWSDPALKEHIRDALFHWVDTYKIDGFRFDYVEGEGWATWDYIRDELRAHDPNLLLIGEDYRYPNDGNSVTHGYDAQWGGNHTDGWAGGGNNFNQVMTTVLTQTGFAWRGSSTPSFGCADFACRPMWAVANVISGNGQYNGSNGDGFSDVKYLESHDENRIVWAVDNYGSAGVQAVGGLQMARVGSLALMTSVGIPLLFSGQEIGGDEYRDADPTLFKPDFTAGDQELRNWYRSLIRLRLSEPALATEHIFWQWRDVWADHYENTVNYWRGSTSIAEDAEIVLVLNFDDTTHGFNASFPADGTWLRLHPQTGAWESVVVNSGILWVDLPAGSGQLFKKADGVTGIH